MPEDSRTMSIEINRAIDEIELGFFYDVNKATVALFYLLQGMETSSHVFGGSQVSPGVTAAGPQLSLLRTFLAVSTRGTDMLGPSGEAVQLAFKGWMADICSKWEKSRTKTRDLLLGEEGIRVQVDCMGDLRHIRNDLIHSGFATKKHSGKCTVLKWFKPGEQIVLTTDHVFDLLNQIGFITLPTQIDGPIGGRIASWLLVPDAVKPNAQEKKQLRIVSYRMDVDSDGENGSMRYMLSCVFGDGVFGQGQVEVPVTPRQYVEGRIDKGGNITFTGGHDISADEIYDTCYDYLSGDRKDSPGIAGPDAKYTK